MLLQALCIISKPLVNWNLSYSPETPNLGQIRQFLEQCDLVIWRMTLKNNTVPLLSNIKLYASFHHHMWIQTGVTVGKQLSWVVTSVTLTFDLWPWPFAWTLLWSLVITPENFMMIQWWEHSQKGVTDRQKENTTCISCLVVVKNNRAPLLSNIKLCASFHHHMWIQTGVTVRKPLSWILTSVTLTFDLWPWPFAWTLLWSLVITSENFMMIRWW